MSEYVRYPACHDADIKLDRFVEAQKKLAEICLPANFPTLDQFRENLGFIVAQKPRKIALTSNFVTASETAYFGQSDWTTVGGWYGLKITEYAFMLAQLMSDEGVYTSLLMDKDPVMVTDTWEVVNGRHRSLALKALGESWVSQSGMNRYITVMTVKQYKAPSTELYFRYS
jgi:hypothetical protein